MSRVGDYDDWDDDEKWMLNHGRWEKNSRTTLESKRGQRALREIEAALLALPEPRLAYETFHKVERDESGKETVQACVLGAYAAHKGVEIPDSLNGEDYEYRSSLTGQTYQEHTTCPAEETASWAEKNLGLAFTLAWNLVELNDREGETPEQRYERVLAYVRAHIKTEATA